MIQKIDFHIPVLDTMKKYPQDLYYIGNLDLLNKKKIGVVGSRSTNQYARELTHKIVSRLAQGGNIIVSGGAIGIDSVAHKAATPSQTIMIAGTGLDKRYPAINKNMIANIEKDGLILSQFAPSTPSLPRNFAIRNELIVALSDILIVSYADLKSGTMRSVEYALKMKKEIYVLPHRLGESDGTNKLLADGKAKAIYDVDNFISKYVVDNQSINYDDQFLEYCKINPYYNDAIQRYGQKIFEAELLGHIKIKNGKIYSTL
jgi:DNA processing protein